MRTQQRQHASAILQLLLSGKPDQVAYGQELAVSLASPAVYRRLFSGLDRDESGHWSMRWKSDGMLRRRVVPWGMLTVEHAGGLWALVELLASQWGTPAARRFTAADIDVLLGMTAPWPEPLVTHFWQKWMVPVAAGTFQMQLPRVRNSRGAKTRLVTLSRSFHTMRTPVTQHLYAALMHTNPSRFPERIKQRREAAGFPVESMRWRDAVRFCEALNARLGCMPGSRDLPDGGVSLVQHGGFRLPTRAEWSYFAAAGQQTLYAGHDDPEKVAWTRLNSSGQSQPVGRLLPNAWGLYDISGNVFEWCWDWYRRRHRYSGRTRSPIVDPTGPSGGISRLRCGGAWSSNPWQSRVRFSHTGGDPVGKDARIGLRPICVVPPSLLASGDQAGSQTR